MWWTIQRLFWWSAFRCFHVCFLFYIKEKVIFWKIVLVYWRQLCLRYKRKIEPLESGVAAYPNQNSAVVYKYFVSLITTMKILFSYQNEWANYIIPVCFFVFEEIWRDEQIIFFRRIVIYGKLWYHSSTVYVWEFACF